jgi:hypothetical protein
VGEWIERLMDWIESADRIIDPCSIQTLKSSTHQYHHRHHNPKPPNPSDGSLSPQATSTKAFARHLVNRAVELGMAQPWTNDSAGRAAPTPFVYLWDERLTSQAARVNIKTKAFLHSCACFTYLLVDAKTIPPVLREIPTTTVSSPPHLSNTSHRTSLHLWSSQCSLGRGLPGRLPGAGGLLPSPRVQG